MRRVNMGLLLRVCALAGSVVCLASSRAISQPPPAFQESAVEFTTRVELAQALMAARGERLNEGRAVAASAADRRVAVDDVWGEGLPTSQKLALFDRFWTDVDRRFAAFQGLDGVNWPALREKYRREVEHGVSAGRFAGIMTALSVQLRESHTLAIDLSISTRTWPEPGVPLFVQGGWFQDFSGACVTAAADGSALVYRAARHHPLGVAPGDRILGYDGRPWAELYRELLDEELPMSPQWWGSSPTSFEHSFVMSAGNNWHLFTTIDVAKANGDVQHLPTARLADVAAFPFCSEQLDIPGVSMPVYGRSWVTWGIVEGTNVGYIYVWGWTGDAGVQFERAVRELTQVEATDGLIIDFRFNVGGNLFLSNAALALLFDEPTLTIGFDERSATGEHSSMVQASPPALYVIPSASQTLAHRYDKPIAVLSGPGAVSSGDQVALRMTYHPRARLFGKGTAAAFNAPTRPTYHANWYVAIAAADAYRVDAPHDYLTHDEVLVDEPVWLTSDDVARGTDSVVAAALAWIRGS
jgi:Peptidase family S41